MIPGPGVLEVARGKSFSSVGRCCKKKKKTIVTQCSVHPQIENQDHLFVPEKKKKKKKFHVILLQGWFWLIWASIRALKVEIKADRLTLCPRSWKGWLVLGPARYCRRESFYCSPQQTVERKQGSNVVKKNKKKLTKMETTRSDVTFLSQPKRFVCLVGIESQPSSLESKTTQTFIYLMRNFIWIN